MQENNNFQQRYEDDEIDLIELFKKIWASRKIVALITGCFTAIGILYALIATPWYQATATFEPGGYLSGDNKKYFNDKKIFVEDIKIRYIDSLKYAKNMDFVVKKAEEIKDNDKLFTIEVIGKSNEIATSIVNDILKDLQNMDKPFIDEYILDKKNAIAQIDRQISNMNNIQIQDLKNRIDYMEKIQLPRLDEQIKYMENNTIESAKREIEILDKITIPRTNEQINLVKENLKQYKDNLKIYEKNAIKNNELRAVVALDERSILNLIVNNEKNLIDLQKDLNLIEISTRPNLNDKLDKLINIDLPALYAQKDEILSHQLPLLKSELNDLQKNKISKLEDDKKVLELALKPYNYSPIKIVSNIITYENPVKPKKLLIVVISFFVGFMVSIFGVLTVGALREKIKN